MTTMLQRLGEEGYTEGRLFSLQGKALNVKRNQLRYSKEKNQSKIGERGIKSAFSSARV